MFNNKLRIPPPEKRICLTRNIRAFKEISSYLYGFTLAEVLITIGIIGIIAAISIPSIITKFKRQSAEAKLKKFYSVMNQAVQMSITEHGDIYIDDENREDSLNSDYITTWYKEYLTKYIKTIKSEKANKAYYEAIFADGSSFNSYMSYSGPTGHSVLYILLFKL